MNLIGSFDEAKPIGLIASLSRDVRLLKLYRVTKLNKMR